MARRDPEQLYNGSAAVDLYRYHGSAAPEIQNPGLPEERPLPQKRQRVRVKAAVSLTAVAGLMVVACMLILVIFGYVQLYEATEEVSTLQSQLSTLQKEQIILESRYESAIDIEELQQKATELGLAVPTREQTIYLNLSGTDRAERYSTESVSLLRRILQAIESSASGLVEYLS